MPGPACVEIPAPEATLPNAIEKDAITVSATLLSIASPPRMSIVSQYRLSAALVWDRKQARV